MHSRHSKQMGQTDDFNLISLLDNSTMLSDGVCVSIECLGAEPLAEIFFPNSL